MMRLVAAQPPHVIKGLQPCRRPQKIDIFIEFYRKKSIFIKFDIKIYIFRCNLGREYAGICLQPLFCCRGTPQGLFSGQKQHFPKFWTWSFFKKVSFRQKLDFWVTYLERCLIKVVHMDRMDHLGFR